MPQSYTGNRRMFLCRPAGLAGENNIWKYNNVIRLDKTWMPQYVTTSRSSIHCYFGFTYLAYICKKFLPALKSGVNFSLCCGVLDWTLFYNVSQWRVTGLWFFLRAHVSSANTSDRDDITRILLKVILSTINPKLLRSVKAISSCILIP